jgi:MFS family permease
MSQAMEERIGRKVLWRLVAPCALFVLFGAIDRTNISFAALQMNRSLGISATEYGFGAGILFVGYIVSKYPSVLLYERVGMSRWLGTITFTWGVGATAMAAIDTHAELYLLRLLIGFAEGGLSSGLMIYLSHWAPERYRASILAIPIMAISIAQVIGAPFSGILLSLETPLGMEAWRFMFLVQGLPAVLLGVFAWFYYPNSPRDARWLTDEEQRWMADNMRGAKKPVDTASRQWRFSALKSSTGWLCAAIWFTIVASNYGVMFWLPQIVRGLGGLTPAQTGWVVALPWAGSAIGLYFNARHSDRTGERYLHVAVPALVGGIGLVTAYLLGPGPAGLLALIIGGACTGCTVAAFWAIPTKLIDPRSLAMGIVMINILGGFAGATVPTAMGFLVDRTGTYLAPTLLLFANACLCALLCMVARGRERHRAVKLEAAA